MLALLRHVPAELVIGGFGFGRGFSGLVLPEADEEKRGAEEPSDDYCPAPDRCEHWGGVEGCQNPDDDCPFDSDEEASVES